MAKKKTTSILQREVSISEKTQVVAVLLIILMAIVGVASYRYGEQKGSNSGYKAGYSDGNSNDPKNDLMDKYYKDETERLTAQYNELVEDYNNLRSSVTQYINANRYQVRQPISCSSNTWGINNQYTSTTCY